LTFFEYLNPPPYRVTGIYANMQQSQDQTTDPTEEEAQKNAMNASVQPGCGMRQANLIGCHPFVLEQPIRKQMEH
jgi:hypothetical protein